MKRRCNSCLQEFPLSEFNKRKASPDGLELFCRTCSKKKAKKQYQKTGKDRHLTKTFKIDAKQYSEMLEKQKGLCAICHRPETGKALAVDHCHHTGIVRGLLCQNCNTALGKFQDNADRLRKAALYLEGFLK